MHELVPIAGGLLVGSLLWRISPRRRAPAGVAAILVVGVVATLVSGEYLIGWEFLAIDVPGAALAAVLGRLLSERLRSGRGHRRPRLRG